MIFTYASDPDQDLKTTPDANILADMASAVAYMEYTRLVDSSRYIGDLHHVLVMAQELLRRQGIEVVISLPEVRD